MDVLGFPKMLKANKTAINYGTSATLLNIYLLLNSKRHEFFGDPEYGTILVEQLFKNNAPALSSIIVDNIYSTITTYIPDVIIRKEDISIRVDRNLLIADIKLYSTLVDNLLSYNVVLDERN